MTGPATAATETSRTRPSPAEAHGSVRQEKSSLFEWRQPEWTLLLCRWDHCQNLIWRLVWDHTLNLNTVYKFSGTAMRSRNCEIIRKCPLVLHFLTSLKCSIFPQIFIFFNFGRAETNSCLAGLQPYKETSCNQKYPGHSTKNQLWKGKFWKYYELFCR